MSRAVSLYDHSEPSPPLAPEEMLILARYALNAAKNTLEGGYPWSLNKPKFTQREARDACLGVVTAALNKIGHTPSNNCVYRDVVRP